MAGELAFVRWFVGIEAIDIFKVRRRGIQPPAVDEEMPVVADLHVLAGLHHHALDIKLILRESLDALGFKYDNFAALRLAKIVSEPVHEQMVARADPHHFYDVIALVINMAWIEAGTMDEIGFTVVRRKPHRLLHAADGKGLG